jgi:hypothetical protein
VTQHPPTPPAGPATQDEVAALYLRARDVPCPACRYNRRDGVAAACPECGVRYNPIAQASQQMNKHLARKVLICTWVIVACSAVLNLTAILIGTYSWNSFGSMILVIASAGSLIATVLALHFALQANKHHHTSCIVDLMFSLAIASALFTIGIGSLILL